MGMKENLGIFKNKNNGKSLLGREILFRGKRIDGGGWVYGNYSEAIFYTTNEREYQIETKDDDYNHYGVFPETVGQFTGLVDKNGDKIFEGDIVNIVAPKKTDYIGIVVWGEYCDNFHLLETHLGFYIKWITENFYRQDIGFWKPYIEVIGNIHDNPEMFKE